MAKGRITGRGAEIAAMRRAGLDLCDAVIVDLCKRGLLTVTPEALDRLAEHERSLQSYKLMRFSRELAAMETRLRAALLRGAVDSSLFVTRLERLQFAARRLRALLDDPAADPLEIEEIAGHTWRDGDLERRENVWLAEMAWESVKTEEGFRVDTSYFAAPGGAAWCERKILPMNIHANIDDSLKPQHPGLRRYTEVGLYPGDLPRRVKLLSRTSEEENVYTTAEGKGSDGDGIVRLFKSAPSSVEEIRASYLNRRDRPFPPDVAPVLLREPLFRLQGDDFHVVGQDGDILSIAAPTVLDRQPSSHQCIDALRELVFSGPLHGVLLLLHDDGNRVSALPAGAWTPDGIIRLGLDAF